MAYKVLNKSNEYFKEQQSRLRDGDDQERQWYDDVKGLEQGEYVVCTKWEQVENILDSFDDNEDFRIEEVRGTFFVLPTNTTTFQKNQFNKAIEIS